VQRKHLFPLGIVLAFILLTVAIRDYPGGTQFDAHSTGFDWKQNYLCNLFSATAINGAVNTARNWAIGGWLFMCMSFCWFYIDFSRKIPVRSAALIIRYGGVAGMLCAWLAVTPFHDGAITAALCFNMIAVLYMLVFVLKSKRTALKILGILLMVIAYTTAGFYYTRFHLEMLPTLQKATLVAFLSWFLWLHYFTKLEDFTPSLRT
jgi:hypothetical protein